MKKSDLKKLVKEEYHNVKSFMEEKYGFTPELGKVISNPYATSFVNEAKEPEVITQLRKIVKNKQNDMIKDTKSGKKVRVDMNSANLMVQVYDALKQQSNKDKFVKSGIVMMGHMAYKLMKKESVNEILTIVDKFDAKKQDYDKMYYKDGGDSPGDGDLKKAKKELAKLSKKHKGLTLVSVGRNSKMYDVMKADESLVNEGKYDGMLDVIEDLVSKAKSFMDVGNQLKKHRVKYSFSTSMIPMYKLDKLPIAIVNKKYVDKADREVGDIAIGLMESIKESVLNERAEPMLTDKEQEIVRKALERAVGVGVDSEPDDTRYHGGNSNFIFDGGEDLMLYVGKYEDEDKPYYVSIEGFDAGKVSDDDAKDFKGIVKAAMKLAKKYKKRLTTESINEFDSSINKRRAGAELKQKLKGKRSDGMGKYTATIYGLDSKGKRVELKSLNDLNKYSKFEIDESVNEGKYYITRNLGRGQGKALIRHYDIKKQKTSDKPKEFKSYKDAQKEVEKLQRGGSMGGQMTAYIITDKNMNPLSESVNENDSYSITDDKGRHFLLIVGEEPKDSKGKSEYKKDGFYISPQKGFKGLITAYFKDEKTLKKNIDKKYHNQLGESINEAKVHFEKKLKSGNIFQVIDRDMKGMRRPEKEDKFLMQIVDKKGKVVKHIGSHPSLSGAKKYSNSLPEGLKEGVMSDINMMSKQAKTLDDFLKKFFKEYGKQIKKNSDTINWATDLYNGVNEAKLGDIKKAVRNRPNPYSLVISRNGKVIDQVHIQNPNEAPAMFRVLKKKHPNDLVALEDSSGRILFTEYVQEYDVDTIEEAKDFVNFMKEYKSDINEAEYQGRDVKLGKPMQGDVKKFKVYVKNPKGNVVKVNFGHGGSSAKGKTMSIRKNNPDARKAFRARHNCDNPGPRHKARYWSCRKW